MSEARVSAEQRRLVTERARGCCEYCRSQEKFATDYFAVEHIVPRHHGGLTELDNLALSCQGCNSHEYTKTQARDPVSGELVPLYHPRRDRWQDHFEWSEDFTLLLGRSAIGRATIEALHLNRQRVVNLRRALRVTGSHPPPEPQERETTERG